MGKLSSVACGTSRSAIATYGNGSGTSSGGGSGVSGASGVGITGDALFGAKGMVANRLDTGANTGLVGTGWKRARGGRKGRSEAKPPANRP